MNGDASVPLLGEEGDATFIVEDATDPGWGPPPQEGASLFQATFNMVNIFMGIGLLSMPYAMSQSGWLGMVALGIATAVFCISGKLIVRNFEKMPADVAHTYPALGQYALGRTGFWGISALAFTEFFGDSLIVLIVMWQEISALLSPMQGVQALGPVGRYVVGFFALSEFYGGSCIVLVVIWRELQGVLPRDTNIAGLSPFAFSVIAGIVATFPLMFIPSFKKLSWLSLLGCISTVVVTVTVVAAVAMDPMREKMPQQPAPRHGVLRWGIFESIGIFAVSVSGHSSLPVLRNSMKRPQAFDSVINWAFTAMLVIYGAVAGLGYYYFGDAASTLITDDLANNSPFTGRSIIFPGLTVDKLVSACILVNAYTTYPCLILVIQDMLWSVLPGLERGGCHRQPRKSVATAVRLLLFAVGCCIAFAAYKVLGNVMSLVGGFASLSCSLLMPSLFYLILFWKELARGSRAGVITLLVMGVALLVLITGQNAWDIAQKAGGGSEDSSRQGGTLGSFIPYWQLLGRQ
ncbi:g12183 [Coccomyxa viridis]|uniref:G12183 protein n=1 Tax=Coccomyxa viridis TaxID=1274662 RepID=A0ABP1G9P1_9CHLO